MPRKLTQQEFLERCNLEHPEYTYEKAKYVNADTKVIVTCPIHGDFLTKPSYFIAGHKSGCPKCNTGFIKVVSPEQFKLRCIKKFPDYDYSQAVFKGERDKITVTCLKHNYTWSVLTKSLIEGHGCPICGRENIKNKQSMGIKEFVKRAREVHNNKYDYSKVEYVNSRTKVCIGCVQHGDFYQTPNNHLRGQGCPKCREYKGEAQISEFLKAHNIEFQTQYPIEYEGNIKGFTYIDFYLPQHNIFIEYNGMQHYIPVEHFGGELKFQQQKKRDQYVRNYCIENNIQLLEIKYGTNIEDELGKYLGT